MEGLIGAFLRGERIGCGRPDCEKCKGNKTCTYTESQRIAFAKARKELWSAKSSHTLTYTERMANLMKVKKILRKGDDKVEAAIVTRYILLAKKIAFAESVDELVGYLVIGFDESVLLSKKKPWDRRCTKVIQRMTEQKMFELLMDTVETAKEANKKE